MVVRIMFDIDESNIPAVLKIMAPHMLGPAIVGPVLQAEPAKPRGAPMRQWQAEPEAEAEAGPPPPPRNGPGRPVARVSLLMAALEVLRAAGNKGLASAAFHDAMIANGLDRKASHNTLFNLKRLSLARQGPNKRIYITREGNARAS